MFLDKVKYILDIPKTIYFNFRYLPFRYAVKLPFFVGHTYKFALKNYEIKFNIPLNEIKMFMIQFGNGGSIDIPPQKYGLISVDKGTLIFNGSARFNAGCTIRVSGGCLSIGDNVRANRNCNISCCKEIVIGKQTLFGYNVSVRDSDGHYILYGEEKSNISEKINIGEHVWICANVTISKGNRIGNDSIIAANSLCIRGTFEDGVLIGGVPAKVLRKNVNWLF